MKGRVWNRARAALCCSANASPQSPRAYIGVIDNNALHHRVWFGHLLGGSDVLAGVTAKNGIMATLVVARRRKT